MSVMVIIVNWNSGDYLDKCLSCLDKQTVNISNIVVLDNKSSDGSIECVKHYKNVTLKLLDSNYGFAIANNKGIFESETDFIALLNPDAFPEPDWIENLLHAAKRNPAVAAFGSFQLTHGAPSVVDGVGDNYHVSGLVWRQSHGCKRTDIVEGNIEIFSACAAAVLYRRAVLEVVGGFDEDFFCYLEDVDLGYRMRLYGYSVHFVPSAVVYHVGSATSGGRHSDFSVYYGHRNLVWCYLKNTPSILLWTTLPIHILLNLVTIFWFAYRGQGKLILRSKWDAIKGIPKMWVKRKEIQSRRKVSTFDLFKSMNKQFILKRCPKE